MAILAAIDRSERAETVLCEAERLADAFNEPVRVVHVVTSQEYTDIGLKGAKANAPVSTDQIIDAAAEIAADQAATLSVPTEAVGLLGDPASQILEYSIDHDMRYIVVGGRKRSPAGKVLTGSVAQTILLDATSPVVFVRYKE